MASQQQGGANILSDEQQAAWQNSVQELVESQRAILNDASSAQTDKDKAQRILNQIEEDAGRIGDEFDETQTDSEKTLVVSCATCLRNYQICINSGTAPSVCMTQYSNCRLTCT